MAINRSGLYEASDQKSLTFVESQAAHIESRVREEVLAKIRWPELVPVDRSMGVYEDLLVTYLARPGTGRMTPLATGAEDLPGTEVEYDVITREAYASGLSYSFTDQEVGRAMKLGMNLKGDKVKAAYRTANEYIEQAVLFGNTDYGWKGLISGHDATGVQAPRYLNATPWSAGDTTTPFETIRQAFDMIWAESDQIEMPDTLLVPTRTLSFLTQMIKVSGSVTTMSLWSYIEENNPFTKISGRKLVIKAINELDKAGTAVGGTGQPRMVLYSSDSDSLRLILPQSLTFLEPQRVGFSTKFYGWMKCGGVQVLKPKSMCVIDGFWPTTGNL